VLERLRARLTAVGFNASDRRPIFITGHSLGGALAALIASWLRVHVFSVAQGTQNRIHLYTYGQPRVGNIHFARAFWGEDTPRLAYHRFARTNDVVPMVPRQDAITLSGVAGSVIRLVSPLALALAPPDCDWRHFGQLHIVREGSGSIQTGPGARTNVESDERLRHEHDLLGQTPPPVDIGAHDMVSSYLAIIRSEFDANYTAWRDGQAGAVHFADDRDELDRFRAAAASAPRLAA
jgi:hypothetical protein